MWRSEKNSGPGKSGAMVSGQKHGVTLEEKSLRNPKGGTAALHWVVVKNSRTGFEKVFGAKLTADRCFNEQAALNETFKPIVALHRI